MQKTLEQKHTEHVNKLFMMCLEILVIFGLPAFVIVFLYKLFLPDAILVQVGLPASFLFSWGVFLLRWKKLSKEVIAVEEEMRQVKLAEKAKEEKEKTFEGKQSTEDNNKKENA